MPIIKTAIVDSNGKVVDASLPSRLQDAALNATIVDKIETEATDPDGLISTTMTGKVDGAKTRAYDSFAGKPNGALVAGTKADTGQGYTTRANAPANAYTITDGYLRHSLGSAGVPSAAYAGLALPRKVGRIWADVVFESGAGASSEVLTLIVSEPRPFTQYADGLTSGFPNSASHFVMSRTTWSYEVLQESPFQTFQIAAGAFAAPLAQDVKHNVSIEFNGTTATIYLPDGTTKTATDARIDSYRGKYATVENYAHTGSSLNPMKVAAWGATVEEPKASAPYTTKPDVIALLGSLVPYKATNYYPATAVTNSCPAGGTAEPLDVTNVVAAGNFGATGKALIRFTGYYEFSAATDLYLSLKNGETSVGGTVQPVTTAARLAPNGVRTVTWLVTGTPGAAFSYHPSQLATTADVATWKAGYPFGQTTIEINSF